MELHGDWKRLAEQINNLSNVDYKKLHEQIGEALVSNTQLRFRNGVAPNNKKWVRGYKARGQILVDSRRLRNAIHKRVTRTGVEVGTNVRYARIHQYGGVIKAKRAKYLSFNSGRGWARKKEVRIPARPFIGIGAEDKQDILEIFKNTLEEAMK